MRQAASGLVQTLVSNTHDRAFLQRVRQRLQRRQPTLRVMGWTLLERASSQEVVHHPLYVHQSFYLSLEGPKEQLSITPAIDDLLRASQAQGRIGMTSYFQLLVLLN